MGCRTALLLNCSEEEAQSVREQARLQRRTLSGYILNILMRTIEVDEKFFSVSRLVPLARESATRPPGPRTTMLLRCSEEEARRIRGSARRRGITISGFVLRSLRRSWKIADEMAKPIKS